MPVALEDRIRVGVLGLEGQHRHESGLVLNTPREVGFPRYRLTSIPGLHSLPEGEDVRESRSGHLGEKARPSLARGKTVTYEGEIQALTLASLRLAGDELRYAFGDRRHEQTMYVDPHDDNPLGVPMSYRARPTALEVDDEQAFRATHVPSPWCRPFVLTLRMGDPRFYDVTEELVVGTDTPKFLVASNPGSAPTDPTFEVTGPAPAGWSIEYHATEPFRVLTVDHAIPDGSTVTVDFAQRRVMLEGEDITGAITRGSNWWDEGVYGIDPRSSGDDVILYGADDATNFVGRWRPAHF